MSISNETDEVPAVIAWQGRLDGGKEDQHIWRGNVTANSDTLTQRFGLDEAGVNSKLEQLKHRLEEFFVEADPQAQVRCIDGRDETEMAPETIDGLGPQIPGGTPGFALTYRLARFHDLHAETIEDDLKTTGELLDNLHLPFRPGAHEDEASATSVEKTGCGAIDKMTDILQLMGVRDAMHGYTKALLGDTFDDVVFDDLISWVQTMNQPDYQRRYFMDGKYGNKLLDTVKNFDADEKSVETLQGAHNELFLIINLAEGQTFDRDSFSKDNGRLAQAFNYDFWHIFERAKDIFHDNELSRRNLITAQAMYAVGTAMALTDGSIEYGLRQ